MQSQIKNWNNTVQSQRKNQNSASTDQELDNTFTEQEPKQCEHRSRTRTLQ